MKLVFVLLAMALLIATPAYSDGIPACQTGSLASYEALVSGCLIGDIVFGSFFYNDDSLLTNKTLVLAKSITVTPILEPDVGLMFSGSFSAGPLNTQDQGLRFNVQTEDGQPNISDFGLLMDATFTNSGLVAIGENANNFAYHLETYTFAAGTQLEDDKTIAPALSSINLRKDILLLGGATGTASLNSFTEMFSEVPEPTSALLFGSVLAISFLFRCRKVG